MQTRRHTADTPLCLFSAYAAQRISAKQSRQARAQAFPHMSWGVPMCLFCRNLFCRNRFTQAHSCAYSVPVGTPLNIHSLQWKPADSTMR